MAEPERSERSDRSSNRNDVKGLATLAFEVVDRVATPVAGVHQAVADRVFTALGPGADGVRRVHDTLSGGFHGSIRTANRMVGRVAGAGCDVVWPGRDLRFLEGSSRGLATLAALNAALGDQLHEDGSDLAIEMQLLHGGEPWPEVPVADARRHLVVFVHGLGGSERSWEAEPSYPAMVEEELGATALALRYNSGRHVSDNGAELCAELERLVLGWPVPVETLDLVGYSMGGLVLRAACHAGAEHGLAWPGRVRRVVYLGTPHRGAPLEQVARLGLVGLARLGETRPLADLGRGRSAGIKDLCHGYVLEDDWRDHDADGMDDHRHLLPLLPGAEHCFVAATVTPRPSWSGLLGDLFVPYRSAAPVALVEIPEPDVTTHHLHVGSTRHLELTHHPEVARQVLAWLS
jgi:pimeloyl-ACP methyl ester carboxylesterase